MSPTSLRTLRLLVVLALPLSACSKAGQPAEPPPQHLPDVPDGYGRAFAAEIVLRVADRKLVLPDGSACAHPEPACAEKLAPLRGRAVALEVDRSAVLGDLSRAFAALAQSLEQDELCLAVRDSHARRCVPFRPFSGTDFSAWIDAPRPLGKIRVVMRSDGMEVVADRGKVPGPDRFGPSLPPTSGRPDFAGLDSLMERIASRFPDEDEAGLAPSAGLPVAYVARALAVLNGPEGKRFGSTFLVYP